MADREELARKLEMFVSYHTRCMNEPNAEEIDAIRQAAAALLEGGWKPIDGWMLVPIEPTFAMTLAYGRENERLGIHAWTNANLIWAAMLSAAPTPPKPVSEKT